MTIPNAVDLASIIGRIVAALRQEQGASQAVLAGRLTWDRSLLARIEAGRNTATIDNIFELEEVFMADGLIESHGDLVELTSRVVHEAKRRGLRPVVGRAYKHGAASVETVTLDRIVARIVDDWLVDLRADPAPTPRRQRRRGLEPVMRDRDDKQYGEDEAAEEDVIALQAIAAMLEVDGDDELAWAQREALAAVGNEALVLKARREERERQEAAERRARRRAHRREERRVAREEAARAEAARRERAAREAAEARTRAERQKRARRQEEARREALRRRRVEKRRRVAPARPAPAAAPPPVNRAPPPVVGEQSPVTGARSQPRQRDAEPPAALKEPDRVLQTEQPPLTGADLARWRSRLGLTQQAAADRLGVRQGTISKAQSRRDKALGPALQAALAALLADGP